MTFVCMRMCMCVWGRTLDICLYFFMKTKKDIISGDFGCPGPKYVNHWRQKTKRNAASNKVLFMRDIFCKNYKVTIL